MSTERRRRSLVRSATLRSKYDPESSVCGSRGRDRRRQSRSTRSRGRRRRCSRPPGPAPGCGARRGGGRRSNGVPSRLATSQKTRATAESSSCQGRSWNVLGSGRARTSASCTRLNPSMADPSKVIPSSRAFSSSADVMLNPLGVPRTSVNHSWTKRMPALFDGPQHVVTLALHPPSFAGAGPPSSTRHRRQAPPLPWRRG